MREINPFTDKHASKRTLAVKLGKTAAKAIYFAMIWLPFVIVLPIALLYPATTLAYAAILNAQEDVAGGNIRPVSGGYVATPTNARAFLWVRYAAWIFVAPLTMVILGLLGGAVLLFLLFLGIESRVAAPLVPLGLFRQRNLSLSAVIGMLDASIKRRIASRTGPGRPMLEPPHANTRREEGAGWLSDCVGGGKH